MDVGTAGIPVTSPTQSPKDADLEPHELYRAIEQAEKLNHLLTLPLNGMFELRKRVKGYTRSDAEARATHVVHQPELVLAAIRQTTGW